MNENEKKSSTKWMRWLVVLVIGLVVWFVPKKPPVFVEFRTGLLSDGVLVVQNMSDKPLAGTIAFFKPNDSKGKGFALLLKPGERREFGALQVGDYAPAVGSHGYIDIDGYIFVRQFELVNKGSFSESSLPWFLAH